MQRHMINESKRTASDIRKIETSPSVVVIYGSFI